MSTTLWIDEAPGTTELVDPGVVVWIELEPNIAAKRSAARVPHWPPHAGETLHARGPFVFHVVRDGPWGRILIYDEPTNGFPVGKGHIEPSRPCPHSRWRTCRRCKGYVYAGDMVEFSDLVITGA